MLTGETIVSGPLTVRDGDGGMVLEHQPCPTTARALQNVGCACPPTVAGATCDTGPVIGADAGLSLASVDKAVSTLDATLRRTGGAPPDWTTFVGNWRARLRQGALTGPELTRWSEQLAQLAERISKARGYQSLTRVAGSDDSTFGTIVGQGFDIPREVRMVDDALSGVWSAVRPFVPYGEAIDTLHRARRGLMYGESTGASAEDITAAQSLSRRARKGDAAAVRELAALKDAAVSDEGARRRWHVYVAVMRDDSKRIDALTAAGAGAGGKGAADPGGAASEPGLGGLGALFGGAARGGAAARRGGGGKGAGAGASK